MAKPIGLILRSIREGAGLTQTAVSRRAGLGPGQLSQIESGRSASPEFSTVARIVAVVGASLDEIAVECGYGVRRSGEATNTLRRLTVANEGMEAVLRSLDGAAASAKAALSELQAEIADVAPHGGMRRRKRSN